MSRLQQLLEEQRTSNLSRLPYYEAFASHRQEQTRLIRSLAAAPETTSERLCVLGAGNAYDLDLTELLTVFAEVHLVDIDADAVNGARARVPESQRHRVLTHAPVDLSGWFQHLERWGRMQVTPQELMAAPAAGARGIAAALPGPFDVVVSTCLLTQLQLTLLPKATKELRIELDGIDVVDRRIAGDAVHLFVPVPASSTPRLCTFTIVPQALLGSTVIQFLRPS